MFRPEVGVIPCGRWQQAGTFLPPRATHEGTEQTTEQQLGL
ncbi:hypothetical protein GZL_02219 [Streptomyces sp. 769]|nr:hypothetical protein GZL_02219 [Streptomyces sp. 769]